MIGLLGGCELLEDLNSHTAAVNVLTTHHSTPEDGEVEPTGLAFENDLGWSVFLEDAVITTSGVALHACDDHKRHDVEMYWGQLPEDLSEGELTTIGLGGVTIPVGGGIATAD